MFKASNTVRLFFVNVAIFSLIGSWLTGFDVVHWFVYVLPVFLLLAAVTGFCPGMVVSGKVLSIFGIKT